jgi:hypothetical protein
MGHSDTFSAEVTMCVRAVWTAALCTTLNSTAAKATTG